MKKDMTIRARKAPAFRAGLPAEERAAWPERPADPSLSDLDEGILAKVVGGSFVRYGPQPDPWIGPYVGYDPEPNPWITSYARFAE